MSGDASNVLTGSYSNMCHMYDRYGQAMASIEVRQLLHVAVASSSGPQEGEKGIVRLQ